MLLHILLLSVLVLIKLCGGYYHDQRFLQNELLKNYNKASLPVLNGNFPLKVNVTFYLMALEGLDERSQTLTTSVFWIFTWKDDILNWKKSKYQNITKLNVKAKDILIPDVFFVNALKERWLEYSEDFDYVTVSPDGNMKWFPAKSLQTSCAVDLSKYPFDIQTCSIQMESWYHDNRDFVLNIRGSGIETSKSHFVENGEWEILNLTATAFQNADYDDDSIAYTGIRYLITLKRRPSYHLLMTMFPFVILMALNLLSLTLPVECGEKLGFCMSQFLTMIVFLTLVGQNMPPSSFAISYFTILIGSQILVSGITISIVAISINLRNRKLEDKPPLFVEILFMPIEFLRYKMDKNSYCVSTSGTEVSVRVRSNSITWYDIYKKLHLTQSLILLINVFSTVFFIIFVTC